MGREVCARHVEVYAFDASRSYDRSIYDNGNAREAALSLLKSQVG